MDQADKLEQLHSLVSLFSANIAQYKSNQYDEANTRTDFIDKFFALLDWDISNNQAFSETYREVVREDKVKIDGSQKAPDYSFRIGGVRKFFVEAKKPSVNIKDAAETAYQVRRYAYTAKLPLSILTNFAEFAVYDTRIKPDKNDKVGVARIYYCTFDQYEHEFDFIDNTFSKNAILKGSFDKYVEEKKDKRGTSEVDIELLALVEAWRVELAKNIAKNNSGLSVYNLNTAVQRIIDRIVFLRIAEDKGIEDENLLLSVAKTVKVYEKLILLFTKANVKYNSGLFASVDWINDIHIDDKVLSNIIVNLYYPECPYEFSVLPVEILGSIYERFLGKTIRFRAVKGDTHTAIIEEKPEVKKAGGVYYTPQYIVDYIVKNTVGEKIKDKTPDEISTIKICDPACGSGSFLVGAYQYLLNYHLDYYTQVKNVKSALKNAKVYESSFKSYKLTIEEKQRILTSSLFGVDIDSQAVEVTKLSLYLKLLENEGKEAKERLFRYSDYALLPSLEDNIKCGNSLIGKDFYSQGNLNFTDEERVKVNCFDWEDGFKEIFKAGGFDVVIGNPPYVLLEDKNRNDDITKYTRKNYYVACSKIDLYHLFIEKSFRLLCNNGKASMIVPSNFISNNGLAILRDFLVTKTCINEILNIKGKVFINASVNNAIFVISRENPGDNFVFKNSDVLENGELKIAGQYNINTRNVVKDIYHLFSNTRNSGLFTKVDSCSCKLSEIAFVNFGKQLRDRKIYKQDAITINRNESIPDGYAKCYTGRDIHKYYLEWDRLICLTSTKAKQGGCWDVEKQNGKYKLITKQIGVFPEFAIDIYGYQCLNTVFMINLFDTNLSPFYLLGILNSELIKWIWVEKFYDKRATFPKIKGTYLKELPIPILDLSKKPDKVKHDQLVSLVNKILELKQKEAVEPNQQLKTMISRQIEGVDKAIDTAVYGLYNLTEDEIKVVEG
jgi:type I restriction-modification system DNA methylase subunit